MMLKRHSNGQPDEILEAGSIPISKVVNNIRIFYKKIVLPADRLERVFKMDYEIWVETINTFFIRVN